MNKKMLRPTILSLALGTALASTASAAQLTDRLIITYKSSYQTEMLDSDHNISNLSTIADTDMTHAKVMYNGAHVVKLKDKKDKQLLKQIIKRLQDDPSIASVEEDILLHRSATANDTYYSLQWHYNDALAGIGLEAAWDTSIGSGVTVAVLDTGYTSHNDLVANLVGGYDMISDAFVGNDGNSGRDSDASDPGDWVVAADGCGAASDSSWHGTHVAGTIAAVTNNNEGVAGIAYGAKVVPVRVLGKCGGYTSDIADGMVWAAGGSVSGVPSNSNPAKVLNLSLGGTGSCSSTSQNAINTAVSLGAVVVVAAGNSNANVSNHNPGNCNNVISVAATNKQADRASYSNYGAMIDLAGPGGEGGAEGVASLLNNGATSPTTDTYVYYAGTSMATPHVAAVAALMFSVDPTLTPAEVESTLKSSARAFPGGSSCSTSLCGDGMLDAAAAVAAVGGGNPPTNQAPTASFSYNCTYLACGFNGSGSTDSDGSITAYSWSFGASGSSANNTFGSAGTYSVTLTVTDNEGATDTDTQSVTVAEEPGPSAINLTVGENRRGTKIQLRWSGASGTKVDIYRNGSRVSRTKNDGAWNDRNVSSGSTYNYQVCEQGSTSACSAAVSYTL